MCVEVAVWESWALLSAVVTARIGSGKKKKKAKQAASVGRSKRVGWFVFTC